ncbi:MAG: CoA transferase [Betaproteobacteria bacterium]|nr:CoA transferase [Betaproteobacteria bacterium]
MKHPKGLELFLGLVKTADVVVENFRPDVKDRLGIDYASLSKVNPRIILGSISGFGQDGPYRDRPGFDQIAQGMSGLMSVTGPVDGEPMRAGAAVCDMAAGLFCALGILTALLEREQSGRGQWVQSSLLHAGIALMDFQAARYLIDGEVPRSVGNDHPTGMPTSTYPTSDGYVNIGASGEAMWLTLCEALDCSELIRDERFASNALRSKHRVALNALLAEAFRKGSKAHWIEKLNRAGVPCGPIYRVDEVFADPQVQHGQIAEAVKHQTRGEIRLIAQAASLSRTPARIARPIALRGEDNQAVLGELGLSPQAIEALKSDAVL